MIGATVLEAIIDASEASIASKYCRAALYAISAY